jgi:hypothetical protein
MGVSSLTSLAGEKKGIFFLKQNSSDPYMAKMNGIKVELHTFQ